jgi:DeoR family transcriptional regulator of aga operon
VEEATTTGLRYRNAVLRRDEIVTAVQQEGFVSIANLSRRLGVSAITIRRDVQFLEAHDRVKATHGGVLAVSAPLGVGSHFRLRAARNAAAKRAIGITTAELVADLECRSLAIDAGTTALEVASALAPGATLTVVTHSLPALQVLASRSDIDVVCVGGSLHPETQSFAGPDTLVGYEGLRMQAMVLTATALNSGQLLCGNSFDAATKQRMMASADRVVLAIDSSKIAISSPYYICDLEEVDTIVIDEGAPATELQQLSERGIEVLVARTDHDN